MFEPLELLIQNRLSDLDALTRYPLLSLVVLSGTIGAAVFSFAGGLIRLRRHAHTEAVGQRHQRDIQSLKEAFGKLSNDALAKNNEIFLGLVQQVMYQSDMQSRHEHSRQIHSIRESFEPLQQSLQRTRAQLDGLDNRRAQSDQAFSKGIAQIAAENHALRQETRVLSQSLQRPTVRGAWGEISLRRLVEASGLIAHTDFAEQVECSHGSRKLKPDMIIRLPGQRYIVIDSKVPLNAYLDLTNTREIRQIETLKQQHAALVRRRINELSDKSYWKLISGSPDFVVMFLPGDQFLDAALEKSPNLIEHAFSKNVILATPTSLMALLKLIESFWKESQLDSQARELTKIASDLHGALEVYCKGSGRISSQIQNLADSFEANVQAFNTDVLPFAKKLEYTADKLDQNRPQNLHQGARNTAG